MSYRGTITTEVDVFIDDVIEEIDDDDLIEEVERRGLSLNTHNIKADSIRALLTTVWEKRRLGKDFSVELDQIIYYGLGKVI